MLASELKNRLSQLLAEPVDALWQRFAQDAGPHDEAGFLLWLRTQAYLSPEQLSQLGSDPG